jgi:hypothetical protein
MQTMVNTKFRPMKARDVNPCKHASFSTDSDCAGAHLAPQFLYRLETHLAIAWDLVETVDYESADFPWKQPFDCENTNFPYGQKFDYSYESADLPWRQAGDCERADFP